MDSFNIIFSYRDVFHLQPVAQQNLTARVVESVITNVEKVYSASYRHQRHNFALFHDLHASQMRSGGRPEQHFHLRAVFG